MRLEDLYDDKKSAYFGNVRHELVEQVAHGSNRVLDVGCGDGSTGAALKAEGRATEVVGAEISEAAGHMARLRLDHVLTGNVETMNFPYSSGYFDYIILGDVLEHLVDPWGFLARISDHLKEEGTAIASMPNVRNWRVVMPLLFRGRWEYEDSGLLDRTHLRFFTKASMVRIFERAGFSVRKVEPLGRKSRLVTRYMHGHMGDLLTPQYLVVARKVPSEVRGAE